MPKAGHQNIKTKYKSIIYEGLEKKKTDIEESFVFLGGNIVFVIPRSKLRADMLFFSNRRDEVSMCHYKENHFWLKKHNCLAYGGPKMVLKVF